MMQPTEGNKESVIKAKFIELINGITLEPEEFRRQPGSRMETTAHNKLIQAIRSAWMDTNGWGEATAHYVRPGGNLGLDFLGRTSQDGRILLAVEVDIGHRPEGSWRKLCDIKADVRAWVYITRDEERSQSRFEEGSEELRLYLSKRGESKTSLPEIHCILKTPSRVDSKAVTPPE